MENALKARLMDMLKEQKIPAVLGEIHEPSTEEDLQNIFSSIKSGFEEMKKNLVDVQVDNDIKEWSKRKKNNF